MKKKQGNGFWAIVCLGVATVAVGAGSIILAGREHAGSTKLDVNEEYGSIKEARQNADGTYSVTITETGYNGEMIIEATYSSDGQTLLAYDVVSHRETENIGTRVDEGDYKAVLDGVRLPVTTAGLDISEILGTEQTNNGEKPELEDGVYTAKTEAAENGDYNYVTLTVKEGKVTEVVWDELTEGASKAELSARGEYVMRPIWKTQSESLGEYVVENQTTAGIMNEAGYTDAVSGVSIYVGGFVDLANQAMAQASKTGTIPDSFTEQGEATKVDVVSGATFSSKAVLRAINKGFVYLRDFVLNK